jgi:hypothetical protein
VRGLYNTPEYFIQRRDHKHWNHEKQEWEEYNLEIDKEILKITDEEFFKKIGGNNNNTEENLSER